MKRRSVILIAPILVLFLMSFNFFKKEVTVEVPLSLKTSLEDKVIYPSLSQETENGWFHTPLLGKSFLGFKEALGFKESQGNYFVTNSFGYLGKYQFGITTLQLIGIYNAQSFLSNPKLQEKAFLANLSRNKWVLRRDIDRFVGRKINGVLITESGILAAAHLAGAGNVKKYLRSGGMVNFGDALGTTVQYYMRKFRGYDVSVIIPNRRAKI